MDLKLLNGERRFSNKLIMQEIGVFIREKRAGKQFSMIDLSTRADIAASYISNIENNKLRTPPSEDAINRISFALGLSTEDKEELIILLGLVKTPDCIKTELYKCRKELGKYKQLLRSMQDSINEVL